MIVQKELNETLFSFIIKWYSSLSFIQRFLNENNIDDMLYFDAQPVGTEFIVTPPLKRIVNNSKPFIPDLAPLVIKAKKEFNQNVFDFILTWYGNLRYINVFLLDNNITDLNEFSKLPVGYVLNIDSSTKNRVSNTFTKNNYKVSTGSTLPKGDFNDDFNNDFSID